MSGPHFDLSSAAAAEMLREGFDPNFPPGSEKQVAAIRAALQAPPDPALIDLRQLPWSSIDNDSSRDLDQIEVADRVNGGIRVRIGIADVSQSVDAGSPIDEHAAGQTLTVYTASRNFSMLPTELSTGLTSLNENQDRAAVVVEFQINGTGSLECTKIYRALVHNKAQLAYSKTGPWLEGSAAPDAKVAAAPVLQQQLRLQDEAAQALRAQRVRLGALEFHRVEAEAEVSDGKVLSLRSSERNRATDLIEDFMIAANEVMARTLKAAKRSCIRRVVKSPERWSRIVDLASHLGASLPSDPDSAALNLFLQQQRARYPMRYPDLSLAVIKLMGPGEYILSKGQDENQPGHFGLAALDYTHSTAPNRRFADLVTQRVVKALLAGAPPPYTDDQLAAIAQHCTERESAARKVERAMQKRVAALALAGSIGRSFHGIITGASEKGVYVRVFNPPVEGRIVRGEERLDVGDAVEVTLLHTDPRHAFIDFAHP
ncbi:MAG TPA: RNB domain-containing ribonuclease [Acidobacteriaceae bacterium]|nr:RNB domain-containing ribonuclease [Acidobacteriaceae bacterium]